MIVNLGIFWDNVASQRFEAALSQKMLDQPIMAARWRLWARIKA
ncbi:MAG TPA: hypothetical protein VFC19_15110 [Candidatus Limnocylindrales bacterium]|nr:hypothetical protein [Candidatus Limnocylindrales bacterium]